MVGPLFISGIYAYMSESAFNELSECRPRKDPAWIFLDEETWMHQNDHISAFRLVYRYEVDDYICPGLKVFSSEITSIHIKTVVKPFLHEKEFLASYHAILLFQKGVISEQELETLMMYLSPKADLETKVLAKAVIKNLRKEHYDILHR